MFDFPEPLIMVDSDNRGFSIARVQVDAFPDTPIERRAFRKYHLVEDETTGEFAYIRNPFLQSQMSDYGMSTEQIEALCRILEA